MSFDNYFMRLYESGYGDRVIEETQEVLGYEVSTEAFYALHAQIDLLVDECDIDTYGATYQSYDRDDWTLARVLDAQDEKAALAKKGNSQVWMAIGAISAAMRAMVVTAVIAPRTTFASIQDVPAPEDAVENSMEATAGPGDEAVLKRKKEIQAFAAVIDEVKHPLELVREVIDVTTRMREALAAGVELPIEETEPLPDDMR